MYVYVGKLNWFQYAENECITIVFPAGIAPNDPVCAYWQWTIDAKGVEKSNCAQKGIITNVTNTNGEHHVRFPFSHYAFEGTISADFTSLSLEMTNPAGEKRPVNLKLEHSDESHNPSASIFTGKLDWYDYSQNEMATLSIPGKIANDEPVILSYQWTKDAAGTTKRNHIVNGKFKYVNTAPDGKMTAEFGDGHYTYNFSGPKPSGEIALHMTSIWDKPYMRGPYWFTPEFRHVPTKKALIVRYGTGTDQGIFEVQKMLVDNLGFPNADVELLYFDIDPDKGPKKCTLGQAAPTVKNFKAKFTKLCAGAAAGDVRCLYVDAHGTTYPDENGSGEKDGNDEGWILAENDDGTRKEILDDDWLAEAIKANVKKGVNLTIITSSCMGGGMLDTHKATPGVLLAGCHETQFNAKALKKMDPWIIAITRKVKKSKPTYTELYNDAKKFIREQIAQGQISTKQYKGPSPDETKPIPRDQATNTSHQDPQLIFYSGYLDPSKEVFLAPFRDSSAGDAAGDVRRFPKDEPPKPKHPNHDEL